MNKLIVAIALLFIGAQAYTQDGLHERANHFNFGFQLNNYQNDFGIGLQLTSPFFAHGHVAIRGHANLQFLQHLSENKETTWSPYGSYQIGVVGVGGMVGGFARFYAEGGLLIITPSSEFSTSNVDIGGYGLFGFEFFMGSDPFVPLSYFIELGGIGSGAKADKVQGSPIYSNGFSISVGFRAYIK